MANKMDKNLVIVRELGEPPDFDDKKNVRIDVWWWRESQNLGLMLAFAHLLQTSPEWRGAKLVLKTVVQTNNEQKHELKDLNKCFLQNLFP